ncbi:MAG: M48 family metallopeptidase [Flavobacteriia bacterium]|nr:M48 family metallopeptidase [Flavobacteriia bacterium]OIP48738.1 MAG: peptidase M48 [Flavobacteriaceae bacterium CG2_30_31_66]PIV95458.1 MAG: peptidase M48 [Flavobacteriaceae bacterium CG17_big_fil_post_rev_8_21_14_2_50_31_13]PIX12531.1 MAG: peptidase M48 [Flavobacteriaceae bacterium CG_4_8_14_3_um_filter_31_8]PIY14167.1 MAG: peptidase M48 [Flavobacteriaceae bacterium CG_4_10_14_3_um_filter_31_253]PIZ10276.1 MAG: peptidase M48 [Flavobacteriaceae bacterium CG_4_10_14_0_8_um_filter_31_99]PJC
MKKIVLLIVVAFLLVDCSTVPITGRKRLNFVGDAEVLPASFAQYKGFLEKNKISTNSQMTNQVKNVGKNVSAAVDRFMRANGMKSEAESYKWEFNLVEDKTVNAWCLPGGKVVFYTGIMPICANDNGVAAVMGHEVAHAFAKHGQERMTSGQLQQIGGLAVAVGTSSSDPKTAQIWNLAYGLGSQTGMLAFSRTHETEADKLGLVFMIMAGYDGNEAAEVWVRMSKLSSGGQGMEFFSTHPSNETRIQTLRNYLPEAKALAAKFNAQPKN